MAGNGASRVITHLTYTARRHMQMSSPLQIRSIQTHDLRFALHCLPLEASMPPQCLDSLHCLLVSRGLRGRLVTCAPVVPVPSCPPRLPAGHCPRRQVMMHQTIRSMARQPRQAPQEDPPRPFPARDRRGAAPEACLFLALLRGRAAAACPPNKSRRCLRVSVSNCYMSMRPCHAMAHGLQVSNTRHTMLWYE